MNIKSTENTWSYKIGTTLQLKIYGLLFFLFGCFLVYKEFTSESSKAVHGSFSDNFWYFCFYTFFLLMGLILFAGFKKIVVNKEDSTYTLIYGIFFPLKSETTKLAKCSKIHLEIKSEKSKNSDGHTTYTTYYPVYMKAKKQGSKEIVKTKNLLTSRKASEELAKLFKVKLIDTSLGEVIERNHNELDDNIKTRLVNQKQKVTRPTPPISFERKVKEITNKYGEPATQVSFGYELKNRKKVFFTSLGLFIVMSSYLIFCYSGMEESSESVKLTVRFLDYFSVPVIIAGLIDFVCLRSVLRGLIGAKISVSPNRILITKSFLFPFKTQMNLNDLEHCIKRMTFESGKVGKITLLSDKKFIETAYEEPEEILDYIIHLVKFKAQSSS